jgi:hypothetical protein
MPYENTMNLTGLEIQESVYILPFLTRSFQKLSER